MSGQAILLFTQAKEGHALAQPQFSTGAFVEVTAALGDETFHRGQRVKRRIRSGRVDLLNSKLNAVLAVPEVREAFLTVGHDPVGGEPEVLAAQVKADLEKWFNIVREKNIRLEN